MEWSLKNIIGRHLEIIGFSIFCLLFWLPSGFYLGGDGYFLGKYQPSLEIIFPYAGVGILLVFLGKFLSKKIPVVPQKQLLFFFFFLAVLGISAQFSLQPESSIIFLILWAIGFFASGFGSTFVIDKAWKRFVFFIGILLGYAVAKYAPNMGVSLDILAIASLILSVHLILNGVFRGRRLMILTLFCIIFASQNLGLIFFTILLWSLAKMWLPRSRKLERERSIFSPLILLVGLTIYGFYQNVFDYSVSSIGIPIFEHWKNLILGFGEGQFLIALQEFSPIYLIPENLVFPKWGIVLSFFEKGFVGVLLLLFLAANPLIFRKKIEFFPTLLFFCFWIFSADYLATENGILLSLVFLFAQRDRFQRMNN